MRERERSVQRCLGLKALAGVVPSSEPAVARSPCPSAASWRATAGDREGIHGAFVGECLSERSATLQQTESRDYRARERLDYRAHTHQVPKQMGSSSSTAPHAFSCPSPSSSYSCFGPQCDKSRGSGGGPPVQKTRFLPLRLQDASLLVNQQATAALRDGRAFRGNEWPGNNRHASNGSS